MPAGGASLLPLAWVSGMILVTGGAGFIGSNVAAALSERGDAVAICDLLGQDDKWRNIAKANLCDVIAPEQLEGWLEQHEHEAPCGREPHSHGSSACARFES